MMSKRKDYRVPWVRPDTSGRVKVNTLEFFVFHEGWYSARALMKDPSLADIYSADPNSRAIQMRLARYAHDGLLMRRWQSGEYAYAITGKGEDRVRYLWKKLGYTDTNRELNGVERLMVELRLQKSLEIVRKRKREQESVLRTP